jgi:hypothetical protein
VAGGGWRVAGGCGCGRGRGEVVLCAVVAGCRQLAGARLCHVLRLLSALPGVDIREMTPGVYATEHHPWHRYL